MALNTVSSDRLSTNVKNTNFTAAEKQDLTDDILPLATQFGQSKNLIINGAMNVAQRGSARSATGQGVGYATADRWKNQWNNFGVQATETVTDLTSSDSPFAEGHRKYLRFALASAGTAAVNSYIELTQSVEAQNLATSGWDYTSSSSKITIQFWFRCSTNQTFYCSLQSYDGTVQMYVFPFTATGNNTWTKITHTIPGNSNITFDNDTGVGLNIRIIPFYGTTYSGTNVTNNSWVAFNTDYVPDMATTWLTAGASTFDFTAVQLEVGSVATDFEHRSFSDELRRCQRYFEKTSMYLSTNGYPFIYQTEKRAAATVTTPDAGGTFHLAGVTPSSTSMWVRRTGGGGQYTVHMDAEL